MLLPPLPLARTVTETLISHQHSLRYTALDSDLLVNRQNSVEPKALMERRIKSFEGFRRDYFMPNISRINARPKCPPKAPAQPGSTISAEP